MSILFEPFTARNLTLKNRVVMAPMTRNFSPNGIPGKNVAEYYHKRAQAEVGLIITEGTVIERPEAANEPNIPLFYGEQPLAGWKAVVDSVHSHNGKVAPQLWHTGLVKEQIPERPRPGVAEGPSGLYKPGKPYGKAMTDEDIADTIDAFARAAADAAALGFDCIEVHGAHGYLIDQFFWEGTNVRSDKWGGKTLAERTAFATALIQKMREAVGDVPLILRISQWNVQDYTRRLAPTVQALEDWVTPLVDAGVDILHCSQRRFWEPEFPEVDGENGLNFAGWVKKVSGVPTISVGSVTLDGDFFSNFAGEQSKVAGLGDLTQRMERGEFDLIAVGRSLIANPDWVIKVRDGRQCDLAGYSAALLSELI